jgi:hypothetical protein
MVRPHKERRRWDELGMYTSVGQVGCGEGCEPLCNSWWSMMWSMMWFMMLILPRGWSRA